MTVGYFRHCRNGDTVTLNVRRYETTALPQTKFDENMIECPKPADPIGTVGILGSFVMRFDAPEFRRYVICHLQQWQTPKSQRSKTQKCKPHILVVYRRFELLRWQTYNCRIGLKVPWLLSLFNLYKTFCDVIESYPSFQYLGGLGWLGCLGCLDPSNLSKSWEKKHAEHDSQVGQDLSVPKFYMHSYIMYIHGSTVSWVMRVTKVNSHYYN